MGPKGGAAGEGAGVAEGTKRRCVAVHPFTGFVAVFSLRLSSRRRYCLGLFIYDKARYGSCLFRLELDLLLSTM